MMKRCISFAIVLFSFAQVLASCGNKVENSGAEELSTWSGNFETVGVPAHCPKEAYIARDLNSKMIRVEFERVHFAAGPGVNQSGTLYCVLAERHPLNKTVLANVLYKANISSLDGWLFANCSAAAGDRHATCLMMRPRTQSARPKIQSIAPHVFTREKTLNGVNYLTTDGG